MNNDDEFSQQMIDNGFNQDGGEYFENPSQIQEYQEQQQNQEEEGDDVIDIDNPDELAAKGLRRIQIEGEEEEFLMDMEGNIYDLRGNFIGTTDGDGGLGEQQVAQDDAEFDEAMGDDQYQDDDY